jgi:hypothetical protein
MFIYTSGFVGCCKAQLKYHSGPVMATLLVGMQCQKQEL